MSELIAEARVLVTPDTTKFRALLTTELTAIASSTPPVPVQVTPVLTSGSGAASLSNLAAQQQKVADETRGATVAQNQATAARKAAESAEVAQARRLSGLSSGASSAALSMVGLRGATLAATGPFLAGAAGAIAFSRAVGTFSSFEQELSVFRVTVGATADEMTRVSDTARQLGRDLTLPGVSATDAAQAITELGRAGLSVNDSLSAARGVLQLATAAQISNADATQLAASALNAFNLSGGQAVRVADVLANAANLAQGGIEDTALALRQAAGAAAVVGVSFEDTAALLTLLARNGLTGSDAGTALRTAFIRLVNPSKEALRVLDSLNVELRDINGNVRPDVFADFAEAQRDLSSAQQQANAAIVFGQDAFRAFGFLGREGRAGLDEVTAGLERQGTAAEVAAARNVGLRGATANLSNQLDALGIAAGEVAAPGVEALVNQAAEAVGVVVDLTGAARELAVAFNELGEDAPGGLGFGDFLDSFGEGAKRVALGATFGPIENQIDFFLEQLRQRNEKVEDETRNLGVGLRSGIEDAGRTAARGAVSFGQQITGALNSAFALVDETLATAEQRFRSRQLRVVRGAGGQQSGLEEAFSGIVAGGGSVQAQIANLRRQAATQARIIEEAGPQAQGVLLQARRAAGEKLASINEQIRSLENRIKADAESAAKSAAQARDDGLRALIESFAPRDTALDIQELAAEDSQNITVIRNVARARKQFLLDQIAVIQERFGDLKDAQRIIRQLRVEIVQLDKETTDTVAEILSSRAAEQERLQDERIQARLEFGESVLDLTGNRNPLLNAINAAIKEATADRNAAKKGSVAWLEAQTAINELLKRRKDALETDEDGGSATTLADLFRENQRIAQQAGNVGNLASGLTSSAQNRPIRDIVQERLSLQVTDPGAASRARSAQNSTDRLIETMERLIATLNGDAPPEQSGRQRRAWRALTEEQRFYYQRTARQLVEQGIGGTGT